MQTTKLFFGIVMRVCSLPYYLIDKSIFSKDFVKEYFYIMNYMIIQMHIDTCLVAHDALDGHEVLVHPV